MFKVKTACFSTRYPQNPTKKKSHLKWLIDIISKMQFEVLNYHFDF